jgi:hypothetical protein
MAVVSEAAMAAVVVAGTDNCTTGIGADFVGGTLG